MTTIRTPDDERPDWLYPPFTEDWWYQGATYPGHSDFAVDFNRRTKSGGWLQDEGDPVLAAQDGEVAEVDKAEGLVMLNHFGGLGRTEYRHMTNIPVEVGEKVRRGDRIGRIGNVAGSGRSTAPHLHMVQWKRDRTSEPFRRTRLTLEGKPLEVSVGDSDTRPGAWKPPSAVLLQGPPPKATWESAFRESEKVRLKAEEKVAGLTVQLGAANEQLTNARRDLGIANTTIVAQGQTIAALEAKVSGYETRVEGYIAERAFLSDALGKANARIAELEAAVPDCNAEVDRAVIAERKVADALAVLTR